MNLSSTTNIAISLVLFAYTLFYTPFIFEHYVPFNIRITTELVLILTTLLLSFFYNRIQRQVIIFMILVLASFSIAMLSDRNNFIEHISFFNKIIILLLIAQVLINRFSLLKLFSYLWVRFVVAISVLTIFAFIGYILGFVDFSAYQFSEGRYYLNNLWLGNISPRNYIVSVPAISGYLFEPIYLGFFFGLNIVISKQLINDSKKLSRFIVLNSVAGLLTFSVTYYLFLLFYVLRRLINDNLKFTIAMIVFMLSLLFVFFYTDMFYVTSIYERLATIKILLDFIVNSDFREVLLGSGVEWYKSHINIGVDSAILVMIINRGVMITIVFLALIYTMTKHNSSLVIFILFYSLAIPFNNFSLFYIIIGLQFALYKHRTAASNFFFYQNTV